jgi:hypothetical protein
MPKNWLASTRTTGFVAKAIPVTQVQHGTRQQVEQRHQRAVVRAGERCGDGRAAADDRSRPAARAAQSSEHEQRHRFEPMVTRELQRPSGTLLEQHDRHAE